jgi:arylsulfatase A-like enzyme
VRIILFDIDSLRPDHLGCYGYPRPTSPNIDRVASDSLCFDRFYCSDSPCLPSRMSWLSGRFGIHTGTVSNVGCGRDFRICRKGYGGPIDAQETVMRQLRRHAGLEAISITNFADRHCAQWFTHGWTEFISPNNKGGEETAEEVNAVVLDWLRKNKGRDDYLLHVNYWDVHRIYKMDASWADRFAGTPAPSWPDAETIARQANFPGPFTAKGQFRDGRSPVPLMPGDVTTRARFEHLITGYDSAIAYADHHIGQVLDLLESQGGLDDTAVIITADHGDAFGEHGIFTDHVCADECIHRIPMIVRWPGVTAPGARCDSLLYNTDMGPTLCELLGAPQPQHWDGHSFAPLLRAESLNEREHLVWGHALYATQRAVRTRRHLLIRTYDPWCYEQFAPIELYDMEADPHQTRDLAAERTDVVGDLDRRLNDWLAEQLTKAGAIADPFGRLMEEQMRLGRTDRGRGDWR